MTDEKRFYEFTDNHDVTCVLEVDPDARLFEALRVAHPNCQVSATVSADLDAFFCAHCHYNARISGAWAVEMWQKEQRAAPTTKGGDGGEKSKIE